MKKYLFIFTAILLLTITSTKAQSIYYGAKAGLNLSNLKQTSNAKMRVMPAFGAFAGYQLTDVLAIQAEALLSWQGARMDNPIGGDVNLTLNYFKIPIVGKLALVDNLSVEGGISFGFLTSARLDGDRVSGFNNFDFALPVGVTYSFMEDFEVGLRYDWSLTKTNFMNVTTSRNTNWLLSLSYRF